MRAAFGDRWGICSNGLMLDAFNPDARNSPSGKMWEQRKREALQKSGCTHLLLCVGRLSPEKGVGDLIACMPRLPGCLLWLIGDGPARPPLEQAHAPALCHFTPRPRRPCFHGTQLPSFSSAPAHDPFRPAAPAQVVAEGVDGSGPLSERVTFWGYQRGEALSAVYTARARPAGPAPAALAWHRHRSR